MNSTIIALASAGCVFGGTLLGLAVRKALPENHLSNDSKDAVKLGVGMISMMAALVLGLLVSSAKNNLDATNKAITDGGAKVILLDRVLLSYGPETKELREGLRQAVAATLELLWPEEPLTDAALTAFESAQGMENLLQGIRALQPKTDAQRALQTQADWPLPLKDPLLFLRVRGRISEVNPSTEGPPHESPLSPRRHC